MPKETEQERTFKANKQGAVDRTDKDVADINALLEKIPKTEDHKAALESASKGANLGEAIATAMAGRTLKVEVAGGGPAIKQGARAGQ